MPQYYEETERPIWERDLGGNRPAGNSAGDIIRGTGGMGNATGGGMGGLPSKPAGADDHGRNAGPVATGPDWRQMHKSATQAYKGKQLGYNPYETQAGPKMGGMNYDPYRQAATNAASSQAGNQFASQQSQLQQAGALSGSDRMKAFSDFNRSKIQGTLGANQQYNQMQSQNQLDVGRFNADRSFDANVKNIAARNDASQFGAMANQRRDLNLYNDGLNQRNLGRQMDAAEIISNSQMGHNQSSNNSVFDKLLAPIFTSFDATSDILGGKR